MLRKIMDLAENAAARYGKVQVPDELINTTDTKILHFGDIPSPCYPYIKRLIKKVKPDIIIHTGDFADELKVSRIPSDVPAYLKCLARLSDIMKESGAEIYVVPGNNDLPEEIKRVLPDARFIEPDTTLSICGVPMLLCHRVCDITREDAAYYLYGHGPTGDNHKRSENRPGKKAYYNTFISPVVICLPSNRVFEIQNPLKIRR